MIPMPCAMAASENAVEPPMPKVSSDDTSATVEKLNMLAIRSARACMRRVSVGMTRANVG
eukprot:5698964-Prymnesium_polylepis.1